MVYDLGTSNTDRAVPYAVCIDEPSKISGQYFQDISDQELEKCKKGK